MIKRAIARSKRLILFFVLASLVAVVGVVAARPVGDWLLVRHYRQRIARAEGREALVLLQQAADMGRPGVDLLVYGLGSANESVSRAADEVIRRRMEDWKSLRTRDSSPLLASLALNLSDSADSFDPAAQARAARFAEEILKRRLDRYAVDRCRVISACQKVIRTAQRTATAEPSPRKTRVDIQADEQTSPEATARENSAITSVPIAQLAALPGGGLPKTAQPVLEGGRLDDQINRLTNRFDPRDLGESISGEDAPAERAPADEPRWFNAPKLALPLDAGRIVTRPTTPSNTAMRLSDKKPADNGRLPNEQTPAGRSSMRPCELETVDLLRRLNDDGPMVAAARNELRLRGFKDHHFRVAEKLFDPDPTVRARLARELPGVSGLNPQPWLLVLARDTNSDVRLTAISLLATASDPAVLAKAESVARRDADRRIQQQAQRIADRRAKR